MVNAAEWHEQLRYVSETVAIVDDFRNWGYTIYRTAYGPSTDQQWQQLLEKIRTQAYAATLRVCEADDPAVQEIWSLFRLDARSDPALDGLSMEQLRLQYRNSDGGVPINADLWSHRVFLLADKEVLLDTNAFLLKCVEADYEAADHVPRNTWLGGQWYFGWMLMRSAEIVELWKELEFYDLDRIAPRTVAGCHPEIWKNMAW
ncbi:hypothetical protein C7974DRAFT_126550 [Boeremia exigua]|uniref:uncharacterized protein n=1 Tax=Boeremia exigua TaxID=749465 RepID=UPI001E8ECB60|nr:uncharacterized protein C7974DRAFT_126550 [Boeremia exigua]KAH6639117.1 hypothetical protein C7974DRAFT_126550 [Boeremia exigua]